MDISISHSIFCECLSKINVAHLIFKYYWVSCILSNNPEMTIRNLRLNSLKNNVLSPKKSYLHLFRLINYITINSASHSANFGVTCLAWSQPLVRESWLPISCFPSPGSRILPLQGTPSTTYFTTYWSLGPNLNNHPPPGLD